MNRDAVIAIGLVGAAVILSNSSSSPPVPTENDRAFIQANSNPFVSGNYSNEREVFEAIAGADSAQAALDAAMIAVSSPPPMDTSAPSDAGTGYNGGLNDALRSAGVTLVNWQKNPVEAAKSRIAALQHQIANLQHYTPENGYDASWQAPIPGLQAQVEAITAVLRRYGVA